MESAYCVSCGAMMAPVATSCPACGHPRDALAGVGHRAVHAAYLERVAASILDSVLAILTLFIGWLIWLFFSLRNGQTPGKQIVGIRAARLDGHPITWGHGFVREILVKQILFGLIAWFTVIGGILDVLWPLWDANKQALHDKIVGTIVVSDRVPAVDTR